MVIKSCQELPKAIPDASCIWPVTGHKGTSQQGGHRFVKQEVVLQKDERKIKVGGTGGGSQN